MPVAANIEAVERELLRLPEVRAVRIVTDTIGTPVEVHVLASSGKHAKQLVRDVQSVAIASHGLQIDHRIVSIVQLDDREGADGSAPVAEPGSADRVSLHSVQIERRALRVAVAVTLHGADGPVTGRSEGAATATATRRAVAEATLAALAELGGVALRTSVDDAGVVRVGERDVAVVVLTMVVPGYEEIVTGSAVVRHGGGEDAVARAVLDACNRRLGQTP